MNTASPGSSSDRNSKGRGAKAIEILVTVVCLVVAGLVVLRRESGPRADLDGNVQLDTPESAILYVCPEDGAVLSVTPAGLDRMLAAGAAGGREGAPMRTPGLYVRCPRCGKRIMVVGVRCPEDGTVFAAFDAHSRRADCPKCAVNGVARRGNGRLDLDPRDAEDFENGEAADG